MGVTATGSGLKGGVSTGCDVMKQDRAGHGAGETICEAGNLGVDIGEPGITAPATNFLDAVRRNIIEEQCHCAGGANTVCTNTGQIIALAPEVEADGSPMKDSGDHGWSKGMVRCVAAEERLASIRRACAGGDIAPGQGLDGAEGAGTRFVV